MNKNSLIRKIYLYIFSTVGLVLVVIGCVRLVNLGLKAYVFTEAGKIYTYPMAAPVAEKNASGTTAENSAAVDSYNRNQERSANQNEAAGSLAMIIVGLPLYIYHWSLVKKEKHD